MKPTDLEQVARECWSHCTHGTPGFACGDCIAAALRQVVRQAADALRDAEHTTCTESACADDCPVTNPERTVLAKFGLSEEG